MKLTKQLPTQRTRAQFSADSFNSEERTIEVVFATETAVRTFDWESYEMVNEVLVCDSLAGNLERLNSGAPVLDNHNRYGKTSECVVGVVESARFDNGVGVAKIRFGNSEDDTALMEKVRDKIITGISVGYNVNEYQVTRKEGTIPVYRATKWEATEISFTPVQADINSRVRSESTQLNEVIINEEITNLNTIEMQEDANTTPAVAVEAPNVEQIRSVATLEERNRVKGINSHVRALGLPNELAETLINENIDLATASQRALTEWEKKQPFNPVQTSQEIETENERTRSAMTNALVLRIDPRAKTAMGVDNVREADQFKGMSFVRFAEESLIRSGVKTSGMTQKDIATLALGGKVRGLHHTTDFPLLLMDTVQRTLLAQYAIQERTFVEWSTRATMNDFRAVSRVRLSEILGNLEKVEEGAEYKYGTFSENAETYKLGKYGKIIGITWEAIINDDLSAFTRIPQAFAVKAANLQSDIVYSMILENAFVVMSDDSPLFSAAHKNFVGTAASLTAGGTALSETSLGLAYTSFREQKGSDGSKLNMRPKFLVVGPKNEFLAGKLTSVNVNATKQSDVTIGALTGLTLIVDARIENYEWFLIADPNMIDTVEYAFLAGYEDLFIEEKEGFNIDGLEVKARLIFAAKAIDWRGMYRNNGAVPV
jgi:Caudovirus prohead serine protease